MKQIYNWFNDLALSKKITYIVIIAGIIPISIIFILTARQLKDNTHEMNMDMLNNGYEQTYQTVDSFLERMYNMSTLASVNDNIHEALKSDTHLLSSSEELMLFDDVTSFTYSLELNMEEATVLYYINENYLLADRMSSRYRSITTMTDQAWAKTLSDNKGVPTWVMMNERNEYGIKADYLAIVRELWDEDDYTKSLGVVSVISDRKNIEKMLLPSLEEQLYYLETSDGQLVLSSGDSIIYKDVIEKNSINSSDGFKEVTINNKEYYARSTSINNGDLYLKSIFPQESLYGDLSKIISETLIWYIIISVLLYFLSIIISKPITNRIKLLDKQMKEDGRLKKIDAPPHQDEIGRLTLRYNSLVDKVEDLMEEQFMIGQDKKGAELKALQSQINPHFLYNTLDMLNWMAMKKETENIQITIQALSKFYRMTLSKGQDIVQIEDEINMCEAYIKIQTLRYKGKINFIVEIENDIREYLIPKITLQPLIENAIIHGISEKEDGRGIILLNGWIENDRIILSVTDDGKGMDNARIKTTKSKGSNYGMSNIEKRLSLYYDEIIKLQVDSSPGIGTCVSISIPMRK